MEKEMIVVTGKMTAVLNGKEVLKSDNIILNVGFELLAKSIMSGTRPAVISHIAVGTGTTATAATQTALVMELARKTCTAAYNADTKTITFSATFGSDTVGAITEAGLVNAASGGTFLDRTVFPVLNKQADDELTINFMIIFG